MNEQDRRGRSRSGDSAVSIDGPEKKGRLGVSQDASANGLCQHASRFTPKDEVFLTLHALPNAVPVKARLVRIEEVKRDSALPWRYLAAAVFEQPVPELENASNKRRGA